MTKRRAVPIEVLDHSMWGPFHKIVRVPVAKKTTTKDRLTRIEDEAAIRDLHSKYCYFYDSGDVDGVMEVFHEDCVLVNPRGTYIGTKAIRENYKYLISTRRFGFHNTTNVVIRFTDKGDEAAMTSYLLGTNLLHSGNEVATLGTYVDRAKKFKDGWKIIERRITSNFRYYLPAFPTLNPPPPPPKPTIEDNTRNWLGPDALL